MADLDSDPRPPPVHPDGGGGDLYRLITDACLDAVVTIDETGKVVAWNGRAEEVFGWSATEILGKPMAEFIIPERYRDRHHQGMEHFLETGEGPILRHRIDLYALRKDGLEIPIELTVSPVRKDGGWMFIAFLRDLTEQRKAAQRLEVQNAVLRILTDTPTLESMEAKLLEAVCMLAPWKFGAFWQREEETLVCSTAYMKPGADVGDFLESTEAATFRKGEGFPGWIWAERGSRCLLDYQSHGYLRTPEAIREDLQSAYGFPVLLGGKVYGVFEFFGPKIPELDSAMMEAITSIANQIGLYMERKVTEDALKESEERFRVLADNAPVLIWITDPEGRCIYVNQPWLDFTGQPLARTVSGEWGDGIHAEDFPALDAALRRVDGPSRPFRLEFRLRGLGGEYRWFLVHGLPRFTPRGEYIGFIGACVDIDESKRAREELAARERRFRALIENSTDAVSISDLAGNIFYASASTENVLGYPEKELVKMNAMSMIHPDDLPALEKEIAVMHSKPGNRLLFEIRVRDKNGNWNWVEGSSVNLVEDPLIKGILTNYRNVTDRKKAAQDKKLAEEQLRQAQKMESVGRLAGGIAHDFNNLLTSINGYSAMALEMLNPQGQMKDFLHEILKSGERAAVLTRQLLAYSRKQTLAPKLWDLDRIVTGMEVMLGRVIGEDIDLAVKCSPEPCMAKVDRGQVEQIILNLVLNARDAMPDGGKLVVETANVDLDAAYVATHLDSAPGPYVMLAVSDSGMGMDEEVKRNLFEPFFTTKEMGKGTGLGLSSVYGIVKQSGGAINVYSEMGMGSTFRVYLPRAVQEPNPPSDSPRPAELESQRGRECVLLVEDEESVRRFSVQALESLGYRVYTAGNGREALDILGREPRSIQLIITDVIMPDMGGNALAEGAKSVCPDIPFLFISGYTETAVTHRGLINAGDRFLQKPYGPAELAKKVRDALDANVAVR